MTYEKTMESERIRRKRYFDRKLEKIGITQTKFAQEIGLQHSKYCALINGRINFTSGMRKVVQEGFAKFGVFIDLLELWPIEKLTGLPCSGMGWGEHTRDAVTNSILDEQKTILREALSELTEKELIILSGRFTEQKTLQQLSKRHGVTRERIRQIEGKALRRLRHHLPIKLSENHEQRPFLKEIVKKHVDENNYHEIIRRRNDALYKYQKEIEEESSRKHREYIEKRDAEFYRVKERPDSDFYLDDRGKRVLSNDNPRLSKKALRAMQKEIYRLWPEANPHLAKLFGNKTTQRKKHERRN